MILADLPQPVMAKAELAAFFAEAFPGSEGSHDDVIEIRLGWARLKFEPAARNLRPGNLVSGPSQVGLADRAAYAVILAHIGPVAMAVTSSLNFSFLRGLQFRTLHADARLLKLGRRLATVDVTLWQDDQSNLVAQSTVT